MNRPSTKPGHGDAGHIVLNGQRLELEEHPTDFSVQGSSSTLKEEARSEAVVTARLAHNMTRARAADPKSRDTLMTDVRKETVAHHIYKVKDTDEEIVINDTIILSLRYDDPQALEEILSEFHLQPQGRMGDAYVLRVTEATGRNPLRTANLIAERPEVESCTPQVMVPMMRQNAFLTRKRLFQRQWYLNSNTTTLTDVLPDADIDAPEAWQITTGSRDIVLAVIDDGFDLKHPAFKKKRIHPARRDYAVAPQDRNPTSEDEDYHGTCVASIATGSIPGTGMMGVAPDCTFLPIRIGFGPMAAPLDILEVFRYVSQVADVVNCSFGFPPATFDRFHPAFRRALTELTRTGGRRGRGLVMVFSAANDDTPTFLRADQNVNGLWYTRPGFFGSELAFIPAGRDVFSGYPMTEGVITVASMSSLKRKSGYSCWGPHITVCAPSNNGHYIMDFIRPGVNDTIRNKFVANYRGKGQIAAVNRPGRGVKFDPLDDIGSTSFREDYYTETFGGTSGAAPVVAGVCALMLSANPTLSANEVRQILIATADKNLDPMPDNPTDPNLQGLSGAFVNGLSLFFGAGKVNAFRAVQRAQALIGPHMPQPLAQPMPEAMEESRPAIGLSEMAMRVLPWEAMNRESGGIGRWNIAGPHNAEPALCPDQVRLWTMARDGAIQELRPDTLADDANDLQPGTFTILLGDYPPQVGHPPHFTELIVRDATPDRREERWLLMLIGPALQAEAFEEAVVIMNGTRDKAHSAYSLEGVPVP